MLTFSMCLAGSLREQGISLFSHFTSSQALIFLLQQSNTRLQRRIHCCGNEGAKGTLGQWILVKFHGVGMEQGQGRKEKHPHEEGRPPLDKGNENKIPEEREPPQPAELHFIPERYH